MSELIRRDEDNGDKDASKGNGGISDNSKQLQGNLDESESSLKELERMEQYLNEMEIKDEAEDSSLQSDNVESPVLDQPDSPEISNAPLDSIKPEEEIITESDNIESEIKQDTDAEKAKFRILPRSFLDQISRKDKPADNQEPRIKIVPIPKTDRAPQPESQSSQPTRISSTQSSTESQSTNTSFQQQQQQQQQQPPIRIVPIQNSGSSSSNQYKDEWREKRKEIRTHLKKEGEKIKAAIKEAKSVISSSLSGIFGDMNNQPAQTKTQNQDLNVVKVKIPNNFMGYVCTFCKRPLNSELVERVYNGIPTICEFCGYDLRWGELER